MSQPEKNWLYKLRDGIPTAIYALIVGVVLLGLFYTIFRPNDALAGMRDASAARGVITLLVAVSFTVISLLLVLFALTGKDGADEKRFDNGKQVLSILVGVLGTILGFYFGSTKDEAPAIPFQMSNVKIAPGSLKVGGSLVVSGQIVGGKPTYSYTITTDPITAVDPVTATSADGKFEATLTVKAGAQPVPTKVKIFATDAEGKVTGTDKQTFTITP